MTAEELLEWRKRIQLDAELERWVAVAERWLSVFFDRDLSAFSADELEKFLLNPPIH